MYDANKLYEKGDYVSSVERITKTLDKDGKLPSESTTKKMFTLIQNSIDAQEAILYEVPDTLYQEKITEYLKVRKIRALLDKKFYSPYFQSFLEKHAEVDLEIAKQYYAYGNSIIPQKISDYKEKATLFKDGLYYAEYKDMRQLMEENAFKYADLSAEESYLQGQAAVKVQDYKTASEKFSFAYNIYKNYGEYKDSRTLFLKYDELWRNIQAQEYYSEAQRIEGGFIGHIKKADYRKAADFYQKAYDVYEPYGDFKSSYNKWKENENKGRVFVYISVDKEIGSSQNWDVEAEMIRIVQSHFSDSFFEMTSNSALADVKLSITYESDYEEYEWDEAREMLDYYGNEYTEIKEFFENKYQLDVKIRISTKEFSDVDFVSLKVGSSSVEVFRDDDFGHYFQSSDGYEKSENELLRETISGAETRLSSTLYSFYTRVKQEL